MIDEASMLTTSLLTLASQVAGRVCNGDGAIDLTILLGGLSVMIIANSINSNPSENSMNSYIVNLPQGTPGKELLSSAEVFIHSLTLW